MSEEIDPEVLADLQLRESSQRDWTRTRGRGVYDWHKPNDVEQWRCRVPTCGAMVGTTQEAVDAAAVFDRELHRRGEGPLDRERIAMCDDCRKRFLKQRADKNRMHVDGMAELIRELKGEEAPPPERERVLIEKIRHMHHPDVDGLLLSIRERRMREQTGAARAKRRSL